MDPLEIGTIKICINFQLIYLLIDLFPIASFYDSLLISYKSFDDAHSVTIINLFKFI